MEMPHVNGKAWPPAGTVLRRLLRPTSSNLTEIFVPGVIVFVRKGGSSCGEVLAFPNGEIVPNVIYAENAWEIVETPNAQETGQPA